MKSVLKDSDDVKVELIKKCIDVIEWTEISKAQVTAPNLSNSDLLELFRKALEGEKERHKDELATNTSQHEDCLAIIETFFLFLNRDVELKNEKRRRSTLLTNFGSPLCWKNRLKDWLELLWYKYTRPGENEAQRYGEIEENLKRRSGNESACFIKELLSGDFRESGHWRVLRKLATRAKETNNPELYVILGFMYMKGIGVEQDGIFALNCFSNGGEVGESFIEDMDRSADHLLIGCCLECQKKYESAVSEYAKVDSSLGKAHLGRLLLLSEHESLGRQLLETVQDCSLACITLGEDCMRRGEYKKAAEYYAKADKHLESQWLSGCAYLIDGNVDKAIECFSKSIQQFADERAECWCEILRS